METTSPPIHKWRIPSLKGEHVYAYIHTYIHTYIVIVIVINTYHAAHWSYRASHTDKWLLPCSIPWVQGLLEVAHSLTKDPKDWGYQPTRIWVPWRLQGISISNGDECWPVDSPRERGKALHCSSVATSNKQVHVLGVCALAIKNQGSMQAAKQGRPPSRYVHDPPSPHPPSNTARAMDGW